MTVADTLLSVTSVAATLDCSRGHVYDLINAGKIRTVSIGIGRSKTRVTESALNAYLRSLGVDGTEPPAGPQQPPNPTKPRRPRAMTDPDPMPIPPDGNPDPYYRTDPDHAPAPQPTPGALVAA